MTRLAAHKRRYMIEQMGTEKSCMDLIDEIYDDFETKVCSRCKYYVEEECKTITNWDCYYDQPCNWMPPDNFGCNKWEAKDES